MTLAAILCPQCSTQNISSARFCGNCGTHLTHPGTPAGSPAPDNSAVPTGLPTRSDASNWHQTAGLICGVISIFFCGIFTAIPGLFFSWSAFSKAKREGKPTGLAMTGLVLNGAGVLISIVLIGITILATLMSVGSGAPDPGVYDMNAMPLYPYGM